MVDSDNEKFYPS